MSALAPLFKGGKFAGVPADLVPEHFITYMLKRDDCFPAVRAKLEAELARRAASVEDAPNDAAPARPLVARRQRAATVEPLPEALQDDEAFEAVVVCPSCGRHARMRGVLSVK